MSALYPHWSNAPYRGALATLVAAPGIVIVGLMIYVRTPYNTGQHMAVQQPVDFDHRHHVIDDRIDCLYCHRGADHQARAGVPSAQVCMGCHAQVWNRSPLLEPVRQAAFTQRPLHWRRVHALADFVYFHHGVHVQAGLKCAVCHGDVAHMPQVEKVRTLRMSFCLDCHRKPRATLAALGGLATASAPNWDRIRADRHRDQIPDPLTTCTTCHR